MTRVTGADGMVWRHSVIGLGLLAVLAGCQGTPDEEATSAEAATDAADDRTAEDGFGEVVGGGSVGGGAGDLGAQLPDVGEFRDPRFGRDGLRR